MAPLHGDCSAYAVGMTAQKEVTESVQRGVANPFWVFAALGVPILAIAWTWYGLAQSEAASEQGKALAAGTTMASFGESFGGIPLVVVHLIGLIILVVLGWKKHGGHGIAVAFLALIIASFIGIGIAQVLWEGQLFQLGIDNGTYVP